MSEARIIETEPVSQAVAIKQQETFPALRASEKDQLFKEKAMIIAKSNLVPDHLKGDWQKILTVMWYGNVVDLDPMQSLVDIYVVKGVPTMSAKLMKALVHKRLPNAIFRIKESTKERCVIEAARDRSDPVSEYIFTREKAEKAGITKSYNREKKEWYEKDNWKNWPEEMLRWRNIAQVCRLEFYDCLMGIGYAPEEVAESTDRDGRPLLAKEQDDTRLRAHEVMKSKYRKVGMKKLEETQG